MQVVLVFWQMGLYIKVFVSKLRKLKLTAVFKLKTCAERQHIQEPPPPRPQNIRWCTSSFSLDAETEVGSRYKKQETGDKSTQYLFIINSMTQTILSYILHHIGTPRKFTSTVIHRKGRLTVKTCSRRFGNLQKGTFVIRPSYPSG